MLGASEGEKPAPRVRKPLERITKTEVDDVADPMVREMVQRKLAELGGDPKKFSTPENLPYFETADGRRIPIKSVRVIKKTPTFPLGAGKRQRFVTSESNHHLEIFAELDEFGEEVEWDGVVVPLAEAYRRKKAHLPMVQKNFGPQTPVQVFHLAGRGCRVRRWKSGHPRVVRDAYDQPIGVPGNLTSGSPPSMTLAKKGNANGTHVVMGASP